MRICGCWCVVALVVLVLVTVVAVADVVFVCLDNLCLLSKDCMPITTCSVCKRKLCGGTITATLCSVQKKVDCISVGLLKGESSLNFAPVLTVSTTDSLPLY